MTPRLRQSESPKGGWDGSCNSKGCPSRCVCPGGGGAEDGAGGL